MAVVAAAMRRFLIVFLLALLGLPTWAQDDLLAKVIKAHGQIQEGEIDAQIDVVGDVDFKGTQDCQLWISRPKLLAWRSQAKLPDQTLTVQIVADGEQLWLYNSSENGHMTRVFSKDVLSLAKPEDGLVMGLHSLILKLMLGDREYLLNDKTLRIPTPTPDAQGECMFELVAVDGDVDQFFVDGKTFLLKRMLGLVEGKPMARAALTYKLAKPDPAVFKFVPPSGSKLVKPEKAEKQP